MTEVEYPSEWDREGVLVTDREMAALIFHATRECPLTTAYGSPRVLPSTGNRWAFVYLALWRAGK